MSHRTERARGNLLSYGKKALLAGGCGSRLSVDAFSLFHRQRCRSRFWRNPGLHELQRQARKHLKGRDVKEARGGILCETA
jgi:hypothetical protein